MPGRMAFNPLPWMHTADGVWRPDLAPPLPVMLAAIKAAGYDGVHAEIPNGLAPRAYLSLLSDHGLLPAPGYFQASFGNGERIGDMCESARKIARDHVLLGLDRIFLAEAFGTTPERFKEPAQGVGADADRLARIAEGIGRVASSMAAEGVIPCLHQHVATKIETVEEAEAVLGAVPETVLKVGPDTGHIGWTGADPVAFLKRHAARIGAVHIKDIRRSVAEAVRRDGANYREAGARHIWTEPGRGDLDLAGAIKALGGFAGWYVVEVDVADQPSVEESAKAAVDWLRPRLAV
ncbi:MAG: TIM barrel protein [Hyphomicrobiales bacterium]|nr:TIM barrel protein [Hyphomicrobiales bacterium]